MLKSSNIKEFVHLATFQTLDCIPGTPSGRVIKIIVFYSKGGDLEADEPTKHSAPVPSKKKFGSLTLPLHTVHQLYSELSHLSFADWLDGELLLFLLLLLAFIVLLLLSEGAAGGRMVQDGGAHG